MSKLRSCLLVAALIAGGISPVSAQEEPKVDCDNAMNQHDMNLCAQQDYEAADKDLNAQWARTRKVMAAWDAEIEAPNKGAVTALLKSQRAWIDYRDGQCDAEGYSVWGGSMYPTIVASCLERLTRSRTEELKELADGIE